MPFKRPGRTPPPTVPPVKQPFQQQSSGLSPPQRPLPAPHPKKPTQRPPPRHGRPYSRSRHPRINELEDVLEPAIRNSRSSLRNDDVLDLLHLRLPPLTPPATANQSVREVVTPTPPSINDDDDDEVYPLDDCIFACANPVIEVFEQNKRRPHRTIYLPRRGQSLDFLLDSGANINVLSFLTCLRLRIPIPRQPTGTVGLIGGKTPMFGKVKMKLQINNELIHTYFYIIENSPNLIGWQLINQFQLFENMYIAGLNQPKLPQFPQPINELLNLCRPTSPMRAATFDVQTIGEPLPSFPLIQIAPRQMTTTKTSFLRTWLEKMETLDAIGPARPTDLLSPIHLVPKYDKSHNLIPDAFRCTVDMTAVNIIFSRIPCIVPSAPESAVALASFENKVVVDLTDGFYHLRCPNDQQRFFGVATCLGLYRFKRMIQGFLNSPATMQTCMVTKVDVPALKYILDHKLDASVLSYIDDVGGGINRGCSYDLLALILRLCFKANLTVVPS